MSPRVFKLGLALFLVMSALFGAKLSMLGAKGGRVSWSMPSFAAATPPAKAIQVAVHAPAKPRAPDKQEARVAEAESAAHTAPLLSESDAALVGAIKRELVSRGYEAGAAPATLDLQARAAIIAFEADNDLRLTGEASQPLLHRLLLGASASEARGDALPGPRAEEVIRSIQAELKRAGNPELTVDGRMSDHTVAAIRAFERDHNLKVTGRVSGALVAKLQPVARDGTGSP
jgi:hypothetical protein